MLLIVIPLLLSSQTITKSVVVLNGGAYSNPDDFVTLATYDPATEITQVIATIFTQSVQGMLVHDGFAYVAAQDSLAKVDVESGEITSIVAITGVNKFAVYNDLLIVSRQFPVTSGFVQIRQVEDLSLVTTFDEISDESWDISVVGDTAYVSVAGGWAATEGKIAVLDMNNLAFVREINLGELAQGIGPSFQNNEHLFFVCKTPWGGTSGTVVKYELSTAGYSLHQYDYSLGKAAGIFDEKLYLMINGNVGIIDLNTLTITNETLIEDTFAGLDITALTIDTTADRIYVNYSYWVAPDGIGKIYDLSGDEVGEYEVGVSSEEVAVNYVDVTGVNDVGIHQQAPAVFPNPCFNYLNVVNIDKNTELSVYDISGRLIVKSISIKAGPQKINISKLIPGIYFLKISDLDDQQLIKFIHRSDIFRK
jgi:hypothetical protein